MYMVAPRIEGLEEITIAEDQLEYKTLTAAVFAYPDDDPDYPGARGVLTRWRLTDEERRRIAAGEDLTLALLTGGGPMQPVVLQVGTHGWGRSAP